MGSAPCLVPSGARVRLFFGRQADTAGEIVIALIITLVRGAAVCVDAGRI